MASMCAITFTSKIYCYGKNLTVGIDIVGGGSAAQLQGEIIVEFPTSGTGLPITAADATRNGLAWITFDGPAAPPFEIDTQLVLETSSRDRPRRGDEGVLQVGGEPQPLRPVQRDEQLQLQQWL